MLKVLMDIKQFQRIKKGLKNQITKKKHRAKHK